MDAGTSTVWFEFRMAEVKQQPRYLLVTSSTLGEAGCSPALAHNRRECPLVATVPRSAPPRTSLKAVQDTLLPALVRTLGGACRALAQVGGGVGRAILRVVQAGVREKSLMCIQRMSAAGSGSRRAL